MNSTPQALVIGATGGIGAALAPALEATGAERHQPLALAATASTSPTRPPSPVRRNPRRPVRPHLDATGALVHRRRRPRKDHRAIDPAAHGRAFALNAIGPALLLKHLPPLLARDRRGVFATLSARVGSIGDNGLGGWYSYRAAKAALNQIVHTAAIEIARKRTRGGRGRPAPRHRRAPTSPEIRGPPPGHARRGRRQPARRPRRAHPGRNRRLFRLGRQAVPW